MFKRGDILKASKRGPDQALHYIVNWSKYSFGSDFEGIMLTHNSKYSDNILLNQSHIKPGFPFKWDKTHFVGRVFIKLDEWGPYKKIGEVSMEGLQFISENLISPEPILFQDYVK